MPDRPFYITHRATLTGLGAGLIVLLAGLTVLIVLVTRPILSESPLAYDRASYPAADGVLCPGAVLRYEVQLRVRPPRGYAGGPIYVKAVRTWINATTLTAARDRNGSSLPAIINEANFYPGRRNAQVTQIVPQLPPGGYLLATTVQGALSGQSGYDVPFTVPKGCP